MKEVFLARTAAAKPARRARKRNRRKLAAASKPRKHGPLTQYKCRRCAIGRGGSSEHWQRFHGVRRLEPRRSAGTGPLAGPARSRSRKRKGRLLRNARPRGISRGVDPRSEPCRLPSYVDAEGRPSRRRGRLCPYRRKDSTGRSPRSPQARATTRGASEITGS
jgi:hypothetical protein